MYPKNACTEIKSRSRNADAEAEKAEAGSPRKCKTQRLAATGNILPGFTLRLAKEISREYLKATVSSNVDPIYNKAVNHVNLIEQLNVLTVEAAGTLSGDQPLVEAKENSKYKTQRLSATVEAAGTVSGDQPLADVAKETPHKENSKYDTPKLTDTGTDASRTSIIKSRSQTVLARIN